MHKGKPSNCRTTLVACARKFDSSRPFHLATRKIHMYITETTESMQRVGILSPNTLVCGDCLDTMQYIHEGSVDMVLCDPPYDITQCKWDSVIPLECMWKQLKRLGRYNCPFVFTSSQPFTSALVMSNPKMFKYQWVWVKSKATGHLNVKKRPLVKHEDLCVFYKKQPVYNPQDLVKKSTPTISKGNRGNKGVGSSGEVYGLANKDAIQTHSGYPN